MGNALPFSINLWVVLGIALALLALLEILFLFARIIENEIALHNLRVCSHRLRLSMVMDSARQIAEEHKFDEELTADSMDAALRLSGLNPQSASDDELVEVIPDEAIAA